jgi:hypothetical protein
MIETFMAVFNKNMHQAGMIISMASQVIKSFEQEYAQDKDAKNAAIDALVAVLNSQKDK